MSASSGDGTSYFASHVHPVIPVLVLFISTMLFSVSSHAGIYKWTDSEGNVHFGDKPQDDDSATEMNINTDKAGITNSSGNEEARKILLKTIDADRKRDAERDRELAEKQAKRQRKCERYKDEYKRHQRASHTYTKTPDGEYNYYSNEDHDALRAKLKKGVSKYCR